MMTVIVGTIAFFLGSVMRPGFVKKSDGYTYFVWGSSGNRSEYRLIKL